MMCESILFLSLALQHPCIEIRVCVYCVIPYFFLIEIFYLGARFGFLTNSLGLFSLYQANSLLLLQEICIFFDVVKRFSAFFFDVPIT